MRALGVTALVALVVAFVVASLAIATGCTTMQRAAQQDPMKCERDPKCDSKRTRSFDCTTQCNDDPACVERCEQVQGNTQLGH